MVAGLSFQLVMFGQHDATNAAEYKRTIMELNILALRCNYDSSISNSN